MTSRIAEGVLYLNRDDWGAHPGYPRLGGPEAGFALIARDKRAYNIVHHTVGIDNDATVNIFETLDEVKAMMRRLQLIRPDLGNDVPYNFVKFNMADHTIVICEGRGYDRSGAHTAGVDGVSPYPYNYFNIGGVATSCAGNFEDFRDELELWLPADMRWFAHLKSVLPNLGTKTVVLGKVTCGHKDFARFSNLNATACPGQHEYAMLPRYTLQEEDDMPTLDEVVAAIIPEIDKRVGATNGVLAEVGRYVADVEKHRQDTAAGLAWLFSLFAAHVAGVDGGRMDTAGIKAKLAELTASDEAMKVAGVELEHRIARAAAALTPTVADDH